MGWSLAVGVTWAVCAVIMAWLWRTSGEGPILRAPGLFAILLVLSPAILAWGAPGLLWGRGARKMAVGDVAHDVDSGPYDPLADGLNWTHILLTNGGGGWRYHGPLPAGVDRRTVCPPNVFRHHGQPAGGIATTERTR